jgi:hypothetical protein
MLGAQRQGVVGLFGLAAVFAIAAACSSPKREREPAPAPVAPVAAPEPSPPPEAPAPAAPAAEEAEIDTRGLRGGGSFFGRPDGDIRERLATLPIKEIKRGYGGRSVAFKITLEDGTTGYYKPEQTFSAAHWWSEVAAYHLDRLLGFGRTPPVVSRRLPWEPLRQTAPGDEHFPEVIVEPGGTVKGSFSYWVPDRLVPISLPFGWERWVRVQAWTANSISPFTRPREYTEAIRARAAERGETPPGTPGEATGGEPAVATNAGSAANGNENATPTVAVAPAAPNEVPSPSDTPPQPEAVAANGEENAAPRPIAGATPPSQERAAELSDLILFDFLTLNTDRWGGANANVLTRGGTAVVFLDNAAGFPRAARNGLMDSRLRVVQRFRRRTIEAIRALDMRAFERRLAAEPLAPILDENQLYGLSVRRRAILDRVAEMEAEFGAEAMPW